MKDKTGNIRAQKLIVFLQSAAS